MKRDPVWLAIAIVWVSILLSGAIMFSISNQR
jgi:hypothetical protein